MTTQTENPLVLKAAWCYYIEGCTQQEISDMLGVSRAKVIRLLEEARESGVIRFVFRENDESRMLTEQQLIERFDLDDAFVAPIPENAADPRDSIAQAAAMYISSRLKDDGYLNIGYGDTIGLMLKHLLEARSDHSLNVVSLTGGVSYYLPGISSQASFGLRLYLTPTPLVVSSRELRDQLVAEPSVNEIHRMTALADMSVLSVGGTEKSATVLRNSIMNSSELTYLKMQGAVGDILNHFINAKGEPVDSELECRTISTSLEELSKMRNVIGVAVGAEKAPPLRAVLESGYLDILITDEATAKEVLAG